MRSLHPWRILGTALVSLAAAAGSSVQAQPPRSVVSTEELLVQAAEPILGASKPDGSRFTNSADRYIDVKVTFAPRSKVKPTGPPVPRWLHLSSKELEEETLARVQQVGLEPVKTSGAFRHAFAALQNMHAKGSDAFLDELVRSRPELDGLPFLTGQACRLDRKRVDNLGNIGGLTRSLIESQQARKTAYWLDEQPPTQVVASVFRVAGGSSDDVPAAVLPALMQILAIETPEIRSEIAANLQRRPAGNDASIAALVRLAIFDPNEEVRSAASEALKREPFEKCAPKLIEGLRYPWPIVAERAAQALVGLEKVEALPLLVKLLDEPDPAAPFEREQDGKKVVAVRELVKINHHRNCAVCHATVDAVDRRSRSELVARVPTPDQALPPMTSQIYYDPNATEVVRASETYLRQDFSILETVADSAPWPEMQRFDYIVRTRILTPAQAEERKRAARPDGEVMSPNRRAVLFALSRLTSTYAGASAAEWRPEIALRLAAQKNADR